MLGVKGVKGVKGIFLLFLNGCRLLPILSSLLPKYN
jgi:hypothetical protein